MVDLKEYRSAKAYLDECEELFRLLEECRNRLMEKRDSKPVEMVIRSIDEASEVLYKNRLICSMIVEKSKS